VGTSKGICVFYTPEAIFENGTSNWDAQTIIIDQDGFNQYLLKEEEVTAIAVDGANRKWIGTRKAGIFVVSEDGTQQIAQYTFENSPLLSNTINSLTIDGVSGELFIGTDVGICSFRTDATTGTETFGHVYAFPNPVEHDYTGTIAVSGLVRDADVKITDVSGNLVYSTVAKGGTAVWNGNLFSGQRAATGVYIVFCTNADGSQTQVTKILFIN
jgi:ligand-binding sensor domain-containing protein